MKSDPKARWRSASPDDALTWGLRISGEPFVVAVEATAPEPFRGKRILEIGPGYGRIVESLASRPFDFYMGLDIAQESIEFLRTKITDQRCAFVQGDCENATIRPGFDVILSSLVFKHLSPNCSKGLDFVARSLNDGGFAAVDFIVREDRIEIEPDGTFIRWYSQPMLLDLIDQAGLETFASALVRHTPAHERTVAFMRRKS